MSVFNLFATLLMSFNTISCHLGRYSLGDPLKHLEDGNGTLYHHTVKLDHFNDNDTIFFSQRYWVDDTYYSEDSGAVVLYICGEWTCRS